MATNQWGEPMPLNLSGPLARAWGRVLIVNEWFDGEEGIQYGAQQRLIREWNENKPSTVVTFNGYGMNAQRVGREFPDRRSAEAYADTLDDDYIEVRPR